MVSNPPHWKCPAINAANERHVITVPSRKLMPVMSPNRRGESLYSSDFRTFTHAQIVSLSPNAPSFDLVVDALETLCHLSFKITITEKGILDNKCETSIVWWQYNGLERSINLKQVSKLVKATSRVEYNYSSRSSKSTIPQQGANRRMRSRYRPNSYQRCNCGLKKVQPMGRKVLT